MPSGGADNNDGGRENRLASALVLLLTIAETEIFIRGLEGPPPRLFFFSQTTFLIYLAYIDFSNKNLAFCRKFLFSVYGFVLRIRGGTDPSILAFEAIRIYRYLLSYG